MKKNSILRTIARSLAVIYILFISLFALDTPILTIGFLIHLIPSIVLATILYVSWKNTKFGAYSFTTLAIIFTIFFNTYKELISFLIITLPLLIIGILFWITKKK